MASSSRCGRSCSPAQPATEPTPRTRATATTAHTIIRPAGTAEESPDSPANRTRSSPKPVSQPSTSVDLLPHPSRSAPGVAMSVATVSAGSSLLSAPSASHVAQRPVCGGAHRRVPERRTHPAAARCSGPGPCGSSTLQIRPRPRPTGYFPLVNGSTTNFSHPFAMTCIPDDREGRWRSRTSHGSSRARRRVAAVSQRGRVVCRANP
jgi:hypothetical protein